MQSQVRFNRVPEKVPEKVWEASGRSGSTRFRRRFPEKVCRFNRVPEKVRRRWFRRGSGRIRWKVPGEGLGGFGAEPGQVQQGSGEGSGEGLGGFGPVRFNKVPKKVPGEGLRLWCRARSGSTGFPRRFGEGPGRVPEKVWEASVQVQPVRFNKVPKKVPGEGLGGFGAEPGQVQQGSEKVPGRVPEKVSEKVWEDPVQLVRFNKVPKKVPGEGLQVQQGSGEGSEKVPGRFPEKVPERVWEDSVEGSRRRSGRLWCRARSGSTGFRRRFRRRSGRLRAGQVQQGSEEGSRRRSEALVQSQIRFNRVSREGSEKVQGGFRRRVWEASVQVQPVRFNKVPKKVPGEGLGGFGAEPGQVQQGSEKVPGRVPEKVSEMVWEDPVQLVRFNKVPKKVPGEGLQVQQGSGEGSEKVPGRFPEKVPEKVWEDSVEGSRRRSGRLWCRTRSSSTGFRRRFGESSRKRGRKAKSALVRRRRGRLAALVQSQVRFKGICSHFYSRKPS